MTIHFQVEHMQYILYGAEDKNIQWLLGVNFWA